LHLFVSLSLAAFFCLNIAEPLWENGSASAQQTARQPGKFSKNFAVLEIALRERMTARCKAFEAGLAPSSNRQTQATRLEEGASPAGSN